MTTEKYRSEALEKGLDILEFLAKNRIGHTQAEIAEGLSRSVGQIFRMLSTLKARGYIDVVNNRYYLGLKINELLVCESVVTRLLSTARSEMDAFSHSTGQPCHLCIYRSGLLVVIHQIDPPTMIGVTIKIGASVDITTTGSGLALLAFSDEQMRSIICEEAGISEDFFIQNQNALERTRRSGIVAEPSKDLVAVTNISVPVYDDNARLSYR
ncbi:IclR family transcriptional regulator [Endozoicomonas ascidiicola]|uniref:IclR family transcriptional regulator n=1 Tax=Endozoicomonas ascidiicola TaxID=1698521 RepID=UPI000829F094|nr:helix-turn-helix domain-containing protein [Endozoicomonas ascidiicola]